VNREGIPSRRSFVNSLSVRRTVSSLGYIPLNWHLFAWWMAASPTSILRGWLLSLAFQNASSPCVRDDYSIVHLSIVASMAALGRLLALRWSSCRPRLLRLTFHWMEVFCVVRLGNLWYMLPVRQILCPQRRYCLLARVDRLVLW
jgi:hypothetical protein